MIESTSYFPIRTICQEQQRRFAQLRSSPVIVDSKQQKSLADETSCVLAVKADLGMIYDISRCKARRK
jgi:hypothetical protein